MTKDDLSTKEKILAVANDLFAKNGFDGTSIREIAKEAGVNLAAISYHFGNKEHLYKEIFISAYNYLEAKIMQLSDDLDSKKLAWEIFLIIDRDGLKLRHTFAMLISDSIPEIGKESNCNFSLGIPPGFLKLAKALIRDYGSDIPGGAIFWCVINIYSQLFHSTLIANSKHCEYLGHSDFSARELLLQGVKHNIIASIEYMNLHKTEFRPIPLPTH